MNEWTDPDTVEPQWQESLAAFVAGDLAEFGQILSRDNAAIVRQILETYRLKVDLYIAQTEVVTRSYLNWDPLQRGAKASKWPTRNYLSRAFRNFILDYLRKEARYKKRHASLSSYDDSGESEGQRDVADPSAGQAPLDMLDMAEQVARLRGIQLSRKLVKYSVIYKLKNLADCPPDDMRHFALSVEERDWMPLARDHPRPMPALLVERRIVRNRKYKRRHDFPSAWFVLSFGMARRDEPEKQIKKKVNLWDRWRLRTFEHYQQAARHR